MQNDIQFEFTQSSRTMFSLDNSYNDNGTNDCLSDRSSDSRRIQNTYNSTNENNINVNINIYRYKFTSEFMNDLFIFSKIHQYDDRSDFKEAWEQWTEDNENIISSEVNRLTNLGYEGDIIDKMYKSARYYFRKKGNEKKPASLRRDYISVSKNLINAMDQHIRVEIHREDYKPSDAFDEFCKSNIDILKENIAIICKNGLTDAVEIKNKIKKTYKNRYFLFANK
uniref:Uncharacterized protein n=1 Tax=viral metagenome TaxID=1070528 RepID=A0A6C0ARG4_9ZZZZ